MYEDFRSDIISQPMLKQICINIATLLYDVKPWIIWSGRGYHIIIPVNAKEALENYEECTSYVNEPSKAFLQFAETLTIKQSRSFKQSWIQIMSP